MGIQAYLDRIKHSETVGWDTLTMELYDLGATLDALWKPCEAGGSWWICLGGSMLVMVLDAFMAFIGYMHRIDHFMELGIPMFFISSIFCVGCLFLLSALTDMCSG